MIAMAPIASEPMPESSAAVVTNKEGTVVGTTVGVVIVTIAAPLAESPAAAAAVGSTPEATSAAVIPASRCVESESDVTAEASVDVTW